MPDGAASPRRARGEEPPPDIRTVSSRVAYENPWLQIREDVVTWPDGREGLFGVVVKPDFAVVLPRGPGGYWMVQQYRYPVRRRTWEFPMGSWPQGRSGSFEELAAAELAEETGLRAGHLRHLGHLLLANGFATIGFHVFVATGLTPGDPRREETELDMVHAFIPDDELLDMIRSGELVDGPSLAALALVDRTPGALDPPGS